MRRVRADAKGTDYAPSGSNWPLDSLNPVGPNDLGGDDP